MVPFAGLNYPIAVAFYGSGAVYAADYTNGRVFKFSPS